MAPMTWTFEATVAAPPDAVYAWLTEYDEDDHRRPVYLETVGAKPEHAGKRRILARTADGVRLEDKWKGRAFTSQVRFDHRAMALTIDGDYGYHAVWRVQPHGDGSRIVVEGQMAPKGLYALLMPLFGGRMRAEMAQDFQGHIADLEHALGAGAEVAGRTRAESTPHA